MFEDAIKEFGESAKRKLRGPGDPEAQLIGPVSDLITSVGSDLGLEVTAHNEVRELEGVVRPDFGVRVNGVIVGHIELKAPGTSLDPATYGRTTHNYRQWQWLRELPNLLHTNGVEWRLWRYGVLVDEPVALHTQNLAETKGGLKAPGRLELLFGSFLNWVPAPILSVRRLVDTIAPLARMLREEVQLALRAERRRVKEGADLELQPFLGIAKDWRLFLFPHAKDREFSDGFAQTIVFALVLAASEGIPISVSSLHDISRKLESQYSLMGKSLGLLTEHVEGTPTWTAIEIIARTLSGLDWSVVSAGGDDVYLHLYEHFLGAYDPNRRKKTGSYYTPIEVVDGMVRLTDDAVKQYLGKSEGLRNPNVSVIDPAMGTGTYPLAVLRHVARAASEQYGAAAGAEAAASAVMRLYGIEVQSGPYSVAELRVSQALQSMGADLPDSGLQLFVADTLEDPFQPGKENLSYALQLVARQRDAANRLKREGNIQVCIGNPPYKDHAGGKGGWIETGTDPATGSAPLDAFRIDGNGKHERHLSNMYVYFWRWATWKVFESTPVDKFSDGDTGIVCFITATGYLSGPGFRGMRKYLRQRCSHGWIINVTPEGLTPPSQNAVFNIETPVAIALFLRGPETDESVPADIRYIDLCGTKEEKFELLSGLDLERSEWRFARREWTASFVPPGRQSWDHFPALDDIFPWRVAGVVSGRGWVYGPDPDVLEQRLRDVVNDPDRKSKSAKFREGNDASLAKVKKPLAGTDVEKRTNVPFGDVVMVTDPKIVRVGFRAFDRQWLVADSRLMIRPSPHLWRARMPGQVFSVELHSEYPRSGPAVVYSALIPDVHYFRGSGGGRSLPRYRPDGSANIAPGLLDALTNTLAQDVSADDVFFYVAGIASHSGFVEEFDDDLRTPGVRIPITADAALWERAVATGRRVVWLHCFGECGGLEGWGSNVVSSLGDDSRPRYEKAVGPSLPGTVQYDEESNELKVGSGVWSNVIRRVRDYTVGGSNVLDSWVGYRMPSPKKKINSPLDSINSTKWRPEWSIELTEVLCVLTQLVELEEVQEELLAEVLGGPLISKGELSDLGVRWPVGDSDKLRSVK